MKKTKPRILVVEDDFVSATLIQEALNRFTYEVVGHVTTGEDTLEQIPQLQPNLVLLDIQLEGGFTGIELAELINKRHQIPIIFISSLSGKQTLEEVKAVEPYGYLIKPFNINELRFNVEIALYRYLAEQERKQLKSIIEQKEEAIKVLQELLPICGWCKKVRNDDGYWNRVEVFIEKSTGLSCSHGICPDCQEKMRGDLHAT